MEKTLIIKKNMILIACATFFFFFQITSSQPVVGVDNWFNHETEKSTGKPYHYLWSDKAFSGYSRWGEIFSSRGATLTTMGKPTYGSLSKIDVYIIVDPDTTSESAYPNYIASADIKAIKQWVKNGGVLAVLANDGPNCEFTHLNMLMSEFGMAFNHVTLHKVEGNNYEMGASKNLPDHPLFRGVTKIFMKDVADIKLSGAAKPVLSEYGKVLIAENKYGKGYVFAIGDPWIYNEYMDHDVLPESFENRKAAENLTDLLLGYVKRK